MTNGNTKEVYVNGSMVKPEHIKEINKQLKKIGSKVPDNFLDDKEHILANILQLACGSGSFGVASIEDINKIGTDEFGLVCDCEKSPSRQVKKG